MEHITKTAMITVCGRPNVGKSSLTNALVGEKIAIVSDKPQTTRNRIYGVVNRGDTQYVLLDTPGLHKPRSRLGDYMVKVVRESLSSVECALLLVEPIAHVGEPERILLQRIREENLPCVLCINKIDTVEKKDALLEGCGLLSCTAGQLAELEPSAVLGSVRSPYGAVALVRRDGVPAGFELEKPTLEDIILFQVKGEKHT